MADNNTSDVLAAFVDVFAERVAEKLVTTCGAGKQLYTVEDLAARYSLSSAAIRQRVQAGEFGEVLQIGKRCYRVTAAGVQRYDAAHMGQAYPPKQSEAPKARRAKSKDTGPP